MKYFVMSIFDTAAQAYAQPFYAPAEQVAIRGVKDMLSGDSQLAKHPEDFELYRLGMFDDNTGEFSSIETVLVARVKDLVPRSN